MSGSEAVIVEPSASSPGGDTGGGGVFPAKQQQNDEAQAPLDDQERRAVQRRLQRRADEKKAEMMAASGNQNGSMSVRDNVSRSNYGAGSYTPKGSWLSGRLTGRRTARGGSGYGGGSMSVRSAAQSTARSMMSTSRSMMTTARSDVATGRYNDVENPEATEKRILEMREMNESLEEEERRRRAGGGGGGGSRTGKTPRKSAASTAAGLRAGLMRRGVQLSNKRNATGRTPRTARDRPQNQRLPGERPAHGG